MMHVLKLEIIKSSMAYSRLANTAAQRGATLSSEKYQRLLDAASEFQGIWHNGSERVVFDRHIMYFDFSEYGKEQPPMIG